jgi:hypothetical protein
MEMLAFFLRSPHLEKSKQRLGDGGSLAENLGLSSQQSMEVS